MVCVHKNGINTTIYSHFLGLRFPDLGLRLLSDMTVSTLCNHFTSVWAEYGLAAMIISDFGRVISEKFKTKCEQSRITLTFSSPYHHQANSLAERTIDSLNVRDSRWVVTVISTKNALTQPCGCTVLLHWMIRCHHPMSYYLDANPKLCCQVPEASWNPNTRKTMLIRKQISKVK